MRFWVWAAKKGMSGKIRRTIAKSMVKYGMDTAKNLGKPFFRRKVTKGSIDDIMIYERKKERSMPRI